LTDNHEKQSSLPQTECLTVRLPEDLMETIRDFCANNDMAIEKFAVDALSEKLSRWKE
jgi:hypothetical protein